MHMAPMVQYGVRYGEFPEQWIPSGERLLEWPWEHGLVQFQFHWIGRFQSPLMYQEILLWLFYGLDGVTDAFGS